MLSSVMSILGAALGMVALLAGALYLWFYWTHRELLKSVKNIPVVLPTWPLLGHSYLAFEGIEELARKMLWMSSESARRGIRTCVFWCGPLPIVVFNDVNDIGVILNSSKTSGKGIEYELFSEVVNLKGHYHLLTAPNHVWKKTRRHMNPLFHANNLQHMEPVFNRNSRLLVEHLAEQVGQGEFDIFHHSMCTGLLTVCNLMFGPDVQIDIKSREFQNLVKFVERVPDLFIKTIFQPWLRVNAIFKALYRNALKEMNSWWRDFSEEKLKVIKSDNEKKNYKSESLRMGKDARKPTDLDLEEVEGQLNIVDIHTLLQQNYPEFGENDLLVEVQGFFCTGTDTMGAGISSCLLALAQYQDVQERLYKEVISVVKGDDDVTFENLNKMPYLDQVIKETLRLFLIVPFTLRRTSKDMELGTCKIPADSTIMVALAGIHMDPKIYPDPTRFDPERFSPGNSSEKNKFSFVPFSAGPRNCVAKTYAMQLMKIAIAHVLRRFKIHTKMDINKLNRKLVVTLVSTDGYIVTLENRNK